MSKINRRTAGFCVLFLSFITIALLLAYGRSEAYTKESRGYFDGAKYGHFTITLLEDRGSERFRIIPETRVSMVGRKVKADQIKRHSRVRVVSEHGDALQIFVEEAPK